MDRHHELDRAALRHRLGALALEGGQAIGRQLPDHRHQDFHLRRRARHGGKHRPPGARAHRRRAGRRQGHFALRRAQADGEGRRLARRAQRRHLRLDRRKDGHPRQLDLRNELRRRRRLAHRRGEPRAQCHVHHDERGPPRRRRARPRAIGSRLSERGGLRQGPFAGPCAHRPEVSRQAGRPDHRASGHSPHAA